MQFIPGTWRRRAVDSDNDGKENPQDIDDAATTGRRLPVRRHRRPLDRRRARRAAVQRYNHTDSYVDLVLTISSTYAKGTLPQSPDGYSTATALLT